MLTGESDDVVKDANKIVDMEGIYSKVEIVEQEAIPAKQINMVFWWYTCCLWKRNYGSYIYW